MLLDYVAMADAKTLDTAYVRLTGIFRSFAEGEITHRVLSGVNTAFASGESVAIRGRSGSGKSTLLNLIAGIDAPDAGSVEVAGLDVTAMTETERTLFRREHIGFVYQAFNLVPTLTIADNVILVLELNKYSRADAGRRALECLAAVGLAERKNSYPDVLSGGEQQRVAIARALCHRPAVLLADEPTGNLDDKTADTVLALLGSLLKDSGTTMIMATHSAAVASFCDCERELRDGRLVDRPDTA